LYVKEGLGNYCASPSLMHDKSPSISGECEHVFNFISSPPQRRQYNTTSVLFKA
jgi:hypothetical protein